MIELYPQIKWVHVAAVLASGVVFLLRGLLVQLGEQRIALATPVRWLSYGIDTILLTAALMLLTMLPRALFANGWLTMKLVLIVTYVGFGTFALKRGRTPRVRLVCYLVALALYAFALSIARTHHPLGVLSTWT